MRRFLIWLLWAVFFALAPYGGGLIVAWIIGRGAAPNFLNAVGSGQLLITSIALIGVAVRELINTDVGERRELRFALLSFSAIHLLITGTAFGAVTGLVALDPTQVPQELIAGISFVVYAISLLISLLTLLVPSTRNVTEAGSDSRG